jgi:hypothetical protein
MDDLDEVRALMTRINDAWLKNPRSEMRATLEDCFAEGMVMRGPAFQELGRGREVSVKSYEDFLDQAKVVSCKLDEPNIDMMGDTAVATLAWQMTYELSGQTYTESGHDLFVFVRSANRWQAAWRALLSSPAS